MRAAMYSAAARTEETPLATCSVKVRPAGHRRNRSEDLADETLAPFAVGHHHRPLAALNRGHEMGAVPVIDAAMAKAEPGGINVEAKADVVPGLHPQHLLRRLLSKETAPFSTVRRLDRHCEPSE